MGALHSGIINAFPDSEIVAVTEVSKFVRSYASKIMNNVNFYSSHNEMLKSENLDGVVICTPVGTHAGTMNDCFDEGISMLVEKPLCSNLEELNFKTEDLINKEVSIITGYCLLFKDTFVKAKKIIDSNALGTILWSKAHINVEQIFKKSNNWQYNKETAGGGVMIGLSSHVISVLVDFFGQEKLVYGLTREHFGNGVEDAGLALIEFDSKVICSLESSWSKFNSRMPKATLEINGEFGQIFVDETEVKLFLSRDFEEYGEGWTNFNQADLFKGVEFDIGGAEFTNQDRFFIDSLNHKDNSWLKNYEISTCTQRIIGKIYGKD